MSCAIIKIGSIIRNKVDFLSWFNINLPSNTNYDQVMVPTVNFCLLSVANIPTQHSL